MLIQREKNVKAFIGGKGTDCMSDLHRHLLALSAQIVGSHVRHNDVATDEIPEIIRNVYSTLADLSEEQVSVQGNGHAIAHNGHDHFKHHHEEHESDQEHNSYEHPSFGQTVFDDRLVCMECGVSMKMLKRHLLTVHGMSPQTYRATWNLPPDYPMVASDYAKLRSSLALESGLGLKPENRPGRKH